MLQASIANYIKANLVAQDNLTLVTQLIEQNLQQQCSSQNTKALRHNDTLNNKPKISDKAALTQYGKCNLARNTLTPPCNGTVH